MRRTYLTVVSEKSEVALALGAASFRCTQSG